MNNVPNLRFKEFSGEWESVMLKDVASIVGGGTPSTTEERYWNGKIPWFTPTEIKEEKYVYESQRTITEEGLQKSSAKLLPKGSILLTTRASLGDMAISIREVSTNQGFQSIIVKDGTSNEFIYYLQPKIKKYCYTKASGSTFLEISKNNIEKFTFRIPNLNEQEKIASFFSLIDKKIELQTEKVEELKNYKKGIMQKIFSQELRFKDENGDKYPEWDQFSIGELAEVTAGRKKDAGQGEYIIMDMGSVTSEGKVLTHKRSSNCMDLLKKGDLVMPKDDIGGGLIIGKTAYIPADNKYILGDHVYRIRFKNNNSLFMHYQINSYEINKQLKRKVTGSAQLGINSKSVVEQILFVPIIEEQNKIGSLLLSLDSKIEIEEEKINVLNQYKKGLLQQMFI